MPSPEPAARRPQWGLGEVVGAFFLATFMLVVAQSLAIGFGANQNSTAVTVAGLGGEWVGFLGVPWAITRARGSASLAKDFGVRVAGWRDVGLGLAAGVGTYLIVLELLYPPFLWVLRQISGEDVSVGGTARTLSNQSHGLGFVVFALAVTVGAPIAEETFFRGLLQPAVQRRLGGWGGVLVTGLVFGLVHAAGTEAAAIPALVTFGVVLGWLAWRTGRLGPGILAHLAFNAITVVQLAASR